MTTHDNNDTQSHDDVPPDIALARAVKNLDRDRQPLRDLWPGIERQIAGYPQRHRENWGYKLLPYGMAASLLIGVTALILSLHQLGNSQEIKYASLERAVGEMQNDFITVRNPSVQRFEQANQGLDEETISLLRKNFEIIEKARQEIELALVKNPENQRLIDMLMRVHQQELDLLNQKYVEPDGSI